MVSIEPCDSFSCSSSRVRTRLSADSAVEIRRKSRASSRIDATSSSTRRQVLAPLAGHLGVQEHDVQQREDGDEPGVARRTARRASGGAPGPKPITASKPIAATASGSPTTSRWKVTRKLTTA